MQDSEALLPQQTELLSLLDAGALEEAENFFKQLAQDDAYQLVLFLHARARKPATTVVKQQLPKLPLEAVSLCAEDHDETVGASDAGQNSSGCELGESFTLSAVGGNISTETPRLDFGEVREDGRSGPGHHRGHQPQADSQAMLKQSLVQRVAAAGGYNTKASLDLQLGDSVADFNLLASRLGGFGAPRMSLLVPAADEQPTAAYPVRSIHECSTAAEDSMHCSSNLRQAARADHIGHEELASPECTALTSANMWAATPSTGIAFGSSVSSEEVELSIPSCSSSPEEAPSSSKAAGQPGVNCVRQSAAEMRASALVGPMSIVLDDLREGEDTASEPTTPGSMASAHAMQHVLSTPAATPVSTGAPSSALSTPSTVGSSVSQHRPLETPAADSSRGNGGLGRVLFAPVNALRKSFTGKRIPQQPAAVAGGFSSSKTCAAAVTSTSSSQCAAAAGRPQSRLPTFTATAGHTPSSNSSSGGRTAGNLGTPSSGYRPPSAASNGPGRTATAASKSPLGKGPDRAASPSPVGSGPRPHPSCVARGAARSPLPAAGSRAQKTAVTAEDRAGSSSSASAGLAWLNQHSDTPTQSPAAASSRTPVSGSRIGSQPVGHTAAVEATAALIGAVRLKSAPVTPVNSRPGTSHSARSVVSAAPHAGSSSVHPPSRIGTGSGAGCGASSSKIPGFSVTEQMVVGKQQRSTPPSSARTAPAGSARSARSAATSTSAASYMRQITDMTGAGAVSRTGSRLPPAGVSDSRQLQTASPMVGSGNGTGMRGAAREPQVGTRFTAVSTSRRVGSRGDAGLGQANSSRICSGAVSGAGRGAAASGASQLRRSRSFGSLQDLQQQTSHQDVSQIRQMWQTRAAAHSQQQQQPYQQQGQQQTRVAATTATQQTGLTVAAPAWSGCSRIPVAGTNQHAPAAAAAGIPACVPEPEECDSPPVMKQSCRSSSSSGHDTSTGGATTGHVPTSDLLGRIDDIIQKARTPTDRTQPAHPHLSPVSAPAAAGYPADAAVFAADGRSKGVRPAAGDAEKFALVEAPGSGTSRLPAYNSQVRWRA